MSADHTIVGAGIVGMSLAFELLSSGLRVRVVDRGAAGHGATWAAGGMLAPVSEAPTEPEPLVELALESLERFGPFVERVERTSGEDCRYHRDPALWVALDRDDAAELDHLAETLTRRGLAFCELDAAEVQEREPHLSGRLISGIEVSGDHQVDPRSLIGALRGAVSALGGELIEGVRVDEVVAESGAVRGIRGVDAEGHPVEWECGSVTVAAGAWPAESIRLPVEIPGLRPVKGQLVRLDGPPLLQRVVRTPDVYLIPRRSGELLVGATMEEVGFDGSPTAGAVMDLLRHAWEALPGIYDLELRELCCGLRSSVEDQLPVIGPTEIDGLYLACGHFRNGVLLAPATAVHLSRAIVGAGPVPTSLEPFLPGRLFRTGGASRV